MSHILLLGADIPAVTLWIVRLTEFWDRMGSSLGSGYAQSWASDHVIASLGGRTVAQALAAGEDPKSVWRAVHAELELPPSAR